MNSRRRSTTVAQHGRSALAGRRRADRDDVLDGERLGRDATTPTSVAHCRARRPTVPDANPDANTQFEPNRVMPERVAPGCAPR